jgi:ribonuclease VapC
VIVLDASSMLAFLFQEEGAEQVADHIEAAAMSTVNLSEILGRFARDGVPTAPVREQLLQTSIEWVAFDVEQADLCAQLSPHTRPLGLSMGDRACLALGASRGLPVLTADRAWMSLAVGVDVRCIR